MPKEVQGLDDPCFIVGPLQGNEVWGSFGRRLFPPFVANFTTLSDRKKGKGVALLLQHAKRAQD
jgi:hypothetical protein